MKKGPTDKPKQTIEVGYSYFSPRMKRTFIIFHRAKRGDLPFYGISDEGEIVQFDSEGEDQWYEFGGNWNTLDLSTKKCVIGPKFSK